MSQERMDEETALHADVQARIGDKLKETYADVLSAPVPDRFLDLLAQLEESSAAPQANGHGGHNGEHE